MELLSWGANSNGQLGLGIVSEQCLTPTRVNLNGSGLNPEKIVQIAGGAGHTLILDNQGSIYGSGSNNCGQLGSDLDSAHFVNISHTIPVKFSQISCGWDFSAAITEGNDLYVWGSNRFGQLGVPTNLHKTILKPVLVAKNIKYVACGLRHTAVITLEGSVMTCGSGIHGQLGLINKDGTPVQQSSTFVIVPDINQIKSISCGQKYTIAIDQSGQIFAWGDNKWGQLGVHPSILKSMIPIKVITVDPDTKIFTGWTHTVLLDRNGIILNWGRNNYGQLGYSNHQEASNWKAKQLFCPKISQLVVGSEHNIAVTYNTKNLLTWGWNEHGNCGNGNEKDIYTPLIITSNIVFIGCGTAQSFAVIKT